MRKPIACFIVFFLALASAVFGQPYHIVFDNFPADPALRAQVDEFAKIYHYVAAWRPEWKFDVPKEKVIGILNDTLAATEKAVKIATAENVDLLLFRGLIRECLYNVDSGGFHETLVAELTELEKKYPADYRAPWLLANHLVYSGNQFQGMKEYDRLLGEVFQGNAVVDVIYDYCTAAYISLELSTCQYMMDQITVNNDVPDPGKVFWMYDKLKTHFKDPVPGNVVPKEQLFGLLEREKSKGFLCRMFGLWLPVKDDWKLTLFDAIPTNVGSFMAEAPFTADNGRHIRAGFSALFQAAAKNDFTSFVQVTMKSLKNPVPLAEWKGKWEATAYEYSDPALYRENGGSRGLVVFVKRSQPKAKGVGIEAPSRIPQGKDSSGVKYYTLDTEYTRFDGDVYYCFLLDSCAAIFDQSKAAFIEWLDGVLLD